MNERKSGRLLVVDDETESLTPLRALLSEWGYEAAGYTSGKDALDALKKQDFDLLLTDLIMPEMDVVELLKAALKIKPHLVGIIMTGEGTIQTAVEAMKVGAFDYILKPLEFKLLRPILSRAMQVRRLRESEEKYRDICEKAPDGIYSLGPDGTILEVNDTWLRMLGYERDEVVGKMKVTELLTADGLKTYEYTFPEFKSRGFVENIDYDLKRKDGRLVPVLINATAIYDENGNFLNSRSIVRNNTVKKKYEEKLLHAAEEWRITFDSMPYGVMLLDTDFNIIRANNYVSSLAGVPIRELIGRKCYVIHGTNKRKESCTLLKSRTDKIARTFEWYETRIGKYFMAYSNPVLDEEGLPKAYVHSLVDITVIKDTEKKLTDSRDAFSNMLKDLDFSYKELKGLYNGLIFSLVYAIDAKSPWTKGHSERVTNYAIAIAKKIGLEEKDIETLNTAALLHDVGKIGTYDVILDKPGKLTAEEFALVKMHPAKGEEILKPISQLKNVLPVIRHHHENMDGKGYPDGLKGDEIPFLSRIIHVADSFDAMTADRPYRPAPSMEYAVSELKKYRGIQFDPEAVDAFLKVLGSTQ